MKQGSIETGATTLPEIERSRSRNLRQLLLRSLRIVSRDVLLELHERGYKELRATHTTLLTNMDLSGDTVTVVAERAGITKQAMGRLAAELEEASYITAAQDPSDARARLLELTELGQRLMLDSLTVMTELERRYANEIGTDFLSGVLKGLAAFVDRDT